MTTSKRTPSSKTTTSSCTNSKNHPHRRQHHHPSPLRHQRNEEPQSACNNSNNNNSNNPDCGWKPVLLGEDTAFGWGGGDSSKKNHYDEDNHNLKNDDLEAEPHEPVGICFGLEVCRDYRIDARGRFQVGVDPATKANQETASDTARATAAASAATTASTTTHKEDADVASKKRSKKSKKKKPNTRTSSFPESSAASTADPTTTTCNSSSSSTSISTIQQEWWQSTGVWLEDALCERLGLLHYVRPTPIQAATLALASDHYYNIVGAAPTGSGKTCAFLLPIVRHCCSLYSAQQQQQQQQQSTTSATADSHRLQALILSPTRELALQIQKEALKLLFLTNDNDNKDEDKQQQQRQHTNKNTKRVACLTGGLAMAKQTRVLQDQPWIVVATPGRLWELISSREHAHLQDLSQIKFLVIDEADRMVRQGSFPQLARILEEVHRANPMLDDDDDDKDDIEDNHSEQQQPSRLRSLPGIPGETTVTMLSPEILRQLQRQSAPKAHESVSDEDNNDGNDSIDDDSNNSSTAEERVRSDGDPHDEDHDDADDSISLPVAAPVRRQTFIYSATLTLSSSSSSTSSSSGTRNGGKKTSPGRRSAAVGASGVDGAIAEILEKAHAKGKTKIVDLTIQESGVGSGKKSQVVRTVHDNNNNNCTTEKTSETKTISTATAASSAFCLPAGLQLQHIRCTQRHKDSHLYAYLMTTVDGSKGPALVFCNSVAAVRRVGGLLQTLGLSVRILHAQMQQRARFKAVESLKNCHTRTVVVATDVAARGLDIPTVAAVIHYDAARTMDTFVHRSGRTARGVGEGAVGCSLSLVAPSEDRFHSKIVHALKVKFATVPMDGRLLAAAQERVNLATKVATAEDAERKATRDNQWLREQAAEAGIEIDDDDMLDHGTLGKTGDLKRDRARQSEAVSAKQRLRVLLSQPMQTQRFGKFLSTNSAATQRVLPEPATVTGQPRKSKKPKKRQKLLGV